MEKNIVSWRTVTSLCSKLVERLKDNYPNINDYNIIGLSRGGLVPSVMVSNMLNIRKVHSLGIKSYDNEQQGAPELYQVPNLSMLSKILVIDDISDTGDSFINTKDMLEGKDVITASLFIKNNTKYKPDVYIKSVDTAVWVVFPWE